MGDFSKQSGCNSFDAKSFRFERQLWCASHQGKRSLESLMPPDVQHHSINSKTII